MYICLQDCLTLYMPPSLLKPIFSRTKNAWAIDLFHKFTTIINEYLQYLRMVWKGLCQNSNLSVDTAETPQFVAGVRRNWKHIVCTVVLITHCQTTPKKYIYPGDDQPCLASTGKKPEGWLCSKIKSISTNGRSFFKMQYQLLNKYFFLMQIANIFGPLQWIELRLQYRTCPSALSSHLPDLTDFVIYIKTFDWCVVLRPSTCIFQNFGYSCVNLQSTLGSPNTKLLTVRLLFLCVGSLMLFMIM